MRRRTAVKLMLAGATTAAVSSGAGPAVGASLLAPALVPAGCGSHPDGASQVYLGAWVPAALDDPRQPLSADPLGQF